MLALLEGHPSARIELVDRFVHHVERVLARILGQDADLEDLVHEVFERALRAMNTLQDPSALRAWITGIAVVTARECIRRRTRGRWLRFVGSEELPEIEIEGPDHESREALRVTYAVLDRLGAEDRIAFVLRHVEGLELVDVAEATGASLNTNAASVRKRLAAFDDRLAVSPRRSSRRIWGGSSRRGCRGSERLALAAVAHATPV